MSVAFNVVLFFGDAIAMMGVTLLPAALAVDWRLHHKISRLRRLTVFAALLLTMHLGYLAWCFGRLLNPPPGVFVLDVHPLDQMLVFTVNWTIPFGSLALLSALVLLRFDGEYKMMLVPVLAFILSAAVGSMYTRWLDQTHFAGLLSERIWWF